MLFMPLAVVALSRVHAGVAGVASSLLNAGQQVGGAMGLAVLGTVAWSAVAGSIRSQAGAASRAGHPAHAAGPMAATAYRHALATGFSRGFEVAAGILLLAPVVAVSAIRVRRADLSGTRGPADI